MNKEEKIEFITFQLDFIKFKMLCCMERVPENWGKRELMWWIKLLAECRNRDFNVFDDKLEREFDIEVKLNNLLGE